MLLRLLFSLCALCSTVSCAKLYCRERGAQFLEHSQKWADENIEYVCDRLSKKPHYAKGEEGRICISGYDEEASKLPDVTYTVLNDNGNDRTLGKEQCVKMMKGTYGQTGSPEGEGEKKGVISTCPFGGIMFYGYEKGSDVENVGKWRVDINPQIMLVDGGANGKHMAWWENCLGVIHGQRSDPWPPNW